MTQSTFSKQPEVYFLDLTPSSQFSTVPLGCFIAYIVDLVITLYYASQEHVTVGKTEVDQALDRYDHTKVHKVVLEEIRTFARKYGNTLQHADESKKDKVLNQIVELIVEYTIKQA